MAPSYHRLTHTTQHRGEVRHTAKLTFFSRILYLQRIYLEHIVQYRIQTMFFGYNGTDVSDLVVVLSYHTVTVEPPGDADRPLTGLFVTGHSVEHTVAQFDTIVVDIEKLIF